MAFSTPPKSANRTGSSASTSGSSKSTAPRAISRKNERVVEEQITRRGSVLDQLMSMFGAYDALNSNINARFDPTIPALMNSQLQSYANLMSGGANNTNSMLSGDYSQTAPSVPVTLGAGNGSPFDLGVQTPGMDQSVYDMFKNLIQPTVNDQMNNITNTLFQMGSPNLYDPANRYQRPSPGLTQPTWESLGGQPPVGQQQFKPISSLPVAGPVAPAASPVQPPPAQKPGDMVPQYAMGTQNVPQTGLAVVHQGEQITPAQQGNVMPVPAPATPATPSTGLAYNQATAPQAAPPAGMSMPGGPVPQLPPPQPSSIPNYGGSANPLQQSIQQLSTMLSSGGPFNQGYQNIQNQQMADQTGAAYQNQLADMRARMGGRGLGGSGLQYGMEGDLFNGLQSALVQGQNQNAINAAGGNWNAMQQGAGALANTALNAGQFGLQQQQAQLGNQMSMFQMLIDALRKSQVNPNDLYGQQVTISPTAA